MENLLFPHLVGLASSYDTNIIFVELPVRADSFSAHHLPANFHLNAIDLIGNSGAGHLSYFGQVKMSKFGRK